MDQVTDLDRVRRETALRDWMQECKQRMAARYSSIDFDAELWPIQSRHGAKMRDINLAPALADFEDMHSSFGDAMRCLAAEMALADSLKSTHQPLSAWRTIKYLELSNLVDLSRNDVRRIEAAAVERAKNTSKSAAAALAELSHVRKFVDRLSAKGVIDRLAWTIAHNTRNELQTIHKRHIGGHRQAKTLILDRQIEALSDAMNALFQRDPRLSTADLVTLAITGVDMCAPSRINEVLCLSVDDYVKLEDYAARNDDKETDGLHAVHQLLITMKGSKGADWGAKPILNFMIDLFNYCLKTITEYGKRSRMLIEWYEANPATLYLAPEIECLRGSDIDRRSLWQIMNLSSKEIDNATASAVGPVWRALKQKVKVVANPRDTTITGQPNRRATIEVLPWADLEPYLLKKVREAMDEARRVTLQNPYKGRLSKMLMLFDEEKTPYLPSSIKYGTIRLRLKQTPREREGYRERNGKEPQPTIFEKLNLTMPVDGKIEFAWLGTHDPRRWLTTQALLARERLPDVIANKWANRLSLEQLKHYDLRTAEQKADQAAMPALLELSDLSQGLASIGRAEKDFGLRTEIVVAQDAGVSVTSMDAILAASENRPVARTSNQIIILYPTKFGACVHQHHETPCRAYNSCLPCDNNHVVKGHLPTNDAVRKRNHQLHSSVVAQLDSLAVAHNRSISDSPEALESHMLTLAREALNPQEMASELIKRFHEVKMSVKDVAFRNKLEEAYVAQELVQRLDDNKVASGAIIKYHNPTRHASPGHERAIDANGGREEMRQRIDALGLRHPQFATTALGLGDERFKIEADDEMDGVDE